MNLIHKNLEDEKENDELKNEFTPNINNQFAQINPSNYQNKNNQNPNFDELVSGFSRLNLNEISKEKMSPKKQEQNNYFNPMMNLNNKNNQKEMGAFNYFFGGGIQNEKKIGENSQILEQLGYNPNIEKKENEEKEKEGNNNFKMKYDNININQQMMIKNNNQKMFQNDKMMIQGNNNNYQMNNLDPRLRNIIQQQQKQNMIIGNNNIPNNNIQNNISNNIKMMNFQRNQNQNNKRKKKNKGNKINNNNNVNIQNMNLIMNNNQQQIPPYNNYQFMQNQNMPNIPIQNQIINNYQQNQNFQNKNQYNNNIGGYIPNNINRFNNNIQQQQPQISLQSEGYSPMNMIGMNMNMNQNNSITLDQLIARTNVTFPGKFYVIKSIDESNIISSIRFKIWCSTIKGNQKLQKAYKEADKKYPIFLFFSVNGSGKFMGIALMASDVEYKINFNYWSQNDKWKGFFVVDWICIKDVPNKMFRSIINDLNENKPVTSSRDTQEICTSAGVKMLKVFRDYPQESTIFDTQNEIKYLNNNLGGNNNINYIENRGNIINNMNLGNMPNTNFNNLGSINNMQNMNINNINNRNNNNIINNLNNNIQNIPNMNELQNLPNMPKMTNFNNMNNMPNINNIPNNYNPMMKFRNIEQNKIQNNQNDFQNNQNDIQNMNFDDLMNKMNNQFEEVKKSEQNDINKILIKKGDTEDPKADK